jgi:hypothetical protein
MLVGPSSAAVAWAGLDYAHTHFSDDDLGVMIFGDSGRAYLSKHIYAKDKKNNNLYTIEKKQATTEHQ